MKNKDQHVIPLGNGCAVKTFESKRFTLITDSKRTAIKVAREIASKKGAKLIIHDKDMKVTESITPPLSKIYAN